ncbi:ABC transporter ATP-binding protein [Streptomyces sp. CBMA29]|uniref:ABC transporter ATP-binding protein n=1 Tax=Streptomyces sp. CBMA29 TaxID=1896314 RepID=UPI002948C3FF|nr:ABC transporter ATP-binding protein [Streptomyces sp. CBMA29]MBD0737567.1 dipeptide/oligopeptide/nickel ABC transporter ATP-binding protein [Streptomyces sp. CBMA29]
MTTVTEPVPAAPVPAGPVLSVRDLRVWYGTDRGPVRAVDGVSFDVRPGETLGLVGESGCGKSTLGRGVLGLTPAAAAVDGEVVLNSEGGAGRNLTELSDREIQKLRGPELGLIFQEPMTRLNPLMRISQHFEEALRTHHKDLAKREVKARALEALRGMGIPESRYESYPHEFSGGMRQRIMIALALVLRPAFIVADEPTTALDVLVEAQIIKILADLRKNFDTALVLITHNLGIVAEACDRVAVMYAGHIVEQGDARAVFADPQHPYTKELLRSTISLSTTGLHYIPGSPPDLVRPPEGCRFHPRCPVAMVGCATAEPPEVTLPSGVHSACWHQAIEADPSLADELGTGGREPLAAVKEISVADEA